MKTIIIRGLCLALALALTSCGNKGGGDGGDGEVDMGKIGDTGLSAEERRQAMLENVSSNVILASYEAFAEDAVGLQTAVDAWASSGDESDRDAAIEAWNSAMSSWQVAELYQLGPAGPMGTVQGGMDLRDQIYSWPTVRPCRVDQEIVEQNYEDVESFREEPVNARGLDALEYLLHHDGPDNQCAPARSINGDGSWDAIEADDLAERRRVYAQTLAADLVTSADALVDAWRSDFGDEFSSAGTSSQTFDNTHAALNALSDSLFYLETEVKDMKLAEPAGVTECSEDVCPDAREFVWSPTNLDAIAANLDGFERAFTGGEGLGFEDLLRDAGQDQLADDITEAVSAARTTLDGIDRPMSELLADDPGTVRDVHQAIKSITDLLKTQFVSVLDLELPQRAEGDND